MDHIMVKNGKKLKAGYTTGSSATAACKAAVDCLFSGEQKDLITIDAPIGWKLHIKCFYEQISEESVQVVVQKDYSDDPDVTKGICVYAKATRSSTPGIRVKAGVGVGVVTKPGLRVAVGQPAINPVPMAMILAEVTKVLPDGEGVELMITIPEGVEIAKKTFNSKLGIIGGISILGTTGIVEPMSEDAYTDSLELELHMNTIDDKGGMVFVFGNFGLDFLDQLQVDNSLDNVVFPRYKTQKTSNFVEIMLQAAKKFGIKKILYIGHAGKMVKVAYGMKNTHSKYGDHRMESIAKSCDKEVVDIDTILKCNTTDEAVVYLKTIGQMERVFNDIALRCKTECEKMSDKQVDVECIVFTTVEGTIGKTPNSFDLLEEIRHG